MSEKVYEELDDAKAEIEKLRAEYQVKANLCDDLKRSHNEQVKRIQKLNLKLEKQAQEVGAKADEIYATKQSLEDLKCKLKEKECIIKSFTSANDMLRLDFNTKLQESEEMKRELVSSLEEANVKILDLEHQNRAFLDKIEVLKEGILSVSQKKCANESKMAKASKQMRERGDMFEKLEEENVKLEEQLKWKKEQFKHLEEAHEKLRNNLRAKEKEWDMEKCAFLDEISTMETKLDSQIRVSEDLQRKLQMCNQALAHEESRHKEAKLKLEGMTNERGKDDEILKNLLSEKECVCKEMEYKIDKLEEENQELMSSLKEQRESHIREANNSSSIAKLRNKLKTLEQIHKDCSDQKVREAEWSSRYEKVLSDLNSCRLKLESKDALLDEYNSRVMQLTMEKEESAVMIVAMESALLEAKSEIDEDKVLVLMKELEGKNSDLVKAEETIKEQRAEIDSLKMVEEELQKEIKNVCDMLDRAKEELGKSFLEVNELRESHIREANNSSSMPKLQNKLKTLEQIHKDREAEWSSQYEKVLSDLNSCRLELESKETLLDGYNSQMLQLTMEKEESAVMMVAMKSKIDEEKVSFLTKELERMNSDLVKAQETIKEQHTEIESLKKERKNVCDLLDGAIEEVGQSFCEVKEAEFELQIWKSVAEKLEVNLEQSQRMRREVEASLLAQVAHEVNLKEENDRLVCSLEEKSKIIDDLEEKIKESKKDENINQVLEEKDERINNLNAIMKCLEEEFDNSTTSFSSKLAKMEAEVNMFHEACEKMTTMLVLKEIEVQEKDLMIEELEKDLKNQVEFEKKCLLGVKKLSLEKENLMGIIGGVSQRINKLSREDGQLMGTLRSIVLSFDEGRKDYFDPVKENTNVYMSPSPKKKMVENSLDERSPLRSLND